MLLWNNSPIKYSILLAGEDLDIDFISSCLKDGIKVLWFGNDSDEDKLSSHFQAFIDAYFLCIYMNPLDLKLVIIDGTGVDTCISKLELLESYDIHFNLQQYVIEHNGTDPLVIVQAGAGSGKTFVMNNRLLYLLHTKEDFLLSDVVMITFTNNATDEMRKKLIELLNTKLLLTGNIKYLKWIEGIPQISISTIHSFFRKVILEVGPLLGYGTNLKMASMVMEKRRILREILDEQYGDAKGAVQSILGLSLYDIEKIAMAYWKKAENIGISGDELIAMDWGKTSTPKAALIQSTLKRFFEEVEYRYNTSKVENNAIAMTDIIHEFSRIIDKEDVKEYISSHYKYIFCDEFQDSDNVQIKTLVVLDKIYDGNLFVVGDIKQSIYRFRGATDSAFLRLNDDIEEVFSENHLRPPYSLSKNYRTSKDILSQIDLIFRTWADKGYIQYEYKSKVNDILTAQVTDPGIYKQILFFTKKDIERLFISLLKKIDTFDKKTDKTTIMVLTRTNYQLQQVKEWCEHAHKACHIRKKGVFFTSPAVREFLAMTEAFLYSAEPMHLYNFLRTSYCFKDVDLLKVSSFDGSKFSLLCYFTDLIEETIEWGHLLDSFRNRPVMAVLCEFISSTHPAVIYGTLQKQRYIEKGYDAEESVKQAVLDAEQYEADLQKLLQMLADEFSDEFSSLSDICNYLRIRTATDNEEEPAELPGDNVANTIQGSTVHSAKGLEFDYVIMPFTDYPFWNDKRSEMLIDRESNKVGWKYAGNETISSGLFDTLCEKEKMDVVGDETRLLYVAMTRAKRGLFCFVYNNARNDGPAQRWADLLPEEYDDADYL